MEENKFVYEAHKEVQHCWHPLLPDSDLASKYLSSCNVSAEITMQINGGDPESVRFSYGRLGLGSIYSEEIVGSSYKQIVRYIPGNIVWDPAIPLVQIYPKKQKQPTHFRY